MCQHPLLSPGLLEAREGDRHAEGPAREQCRHAKPQLLQQRLMQQLLGWMLSGMDAPLGWMLGCTAGSGLAEQRESVPTDGLAITW